MKIITLSGLDGSGKSTQIEFLKDYLKLKDKTFFYFHGAGFSISSLYKTFPIFSWKKTKEKAKKDEGVVKANWIEIQLRKIALLIDIFRFKRLLKKKNVDYIISDRYFYDTVVNIMFLSSCHPRESGDPEINDLIFSTGSRVKPGMTTLEKLIPKPDFAFFINVKPEIIMQRERKPDQGMEYLRAKEKLFESKIKDWNIIVVDGERNKEEIFSEIKSRINV